MCNYHLTQAEYNLMEIIWIHHPITSSDLVKVCAGEFDWKKSTTYTNLKKLVIKGMVSNHNAIVNVLVSKAEYENCQRKEVIQHYFSDSLPQFLLAFIREQNLNKEDLKELEEIIREYKEELND